MKCIKRQKTLEIIISNKDNLNLLDESLREISRNLDLEFDKLDGKLPDLIYIKVKKTYSHPTNSVVALISHRVTDFYSPANFRKLNIAVYDKNYQNYIISVSHSRNYKIGNLLDSPKN